MKIYKTKQEKRGVYTYPINVQIGDENCKTSYITIKPNENGVTEADIKLLHSLDDSEVYYNNKNMHTTRTDEEKAKIRDFKKKFSDDYLKKNGYKPNKDELEYAIKDAFPVNWNASLDWTLENESGKDKNRLISETCTYMEESDTVSERLFEVMETLTDKQRDVLKLVKLEGYTLTEVSEILGTSIPNTKKHLDKALKYIENNYFKKN